jgi:hypothetical protein
VRFTEEEVKRAVDIVAIDWSQRHKELNGIIRKAELFSKAVEMTLSLHEELHTAKVGIADNPVDRLFEDLTQGDYAVMPTAKDETIAWAVWHIARIEDLTMNILVNNDAQVYNETWKKRLKVTVTDTGNAMTDDEIMAFSRQVCAAELLNYRAAVGIKSREILRKLTAADMKRKVSPDSIDRLLHEGGVTEQADSRWLLDFWGKKDVAGILLMPLTRHQTLHLNDCYRWKEHIRGKKKCFAV